MSDYFFVFSLLAAPDRCVTGEPVWQVRADITYIYNTQQYYTVTILQKKEGDRQTDNERGVAEPALTRDQVATDGIAHETTQSYRRFKDKR